MSEEDLSASSYQEMLERSFSMFEPRKVSDKETKIDETASFRKYVLRSTPSSSTSSTPDSDSTILFNVPSNEAEFEDEYDKVELGLRKCFNCTPQRACDLHAISNLTHHRPYSTFSTTSVLRRILDHYEGKNHSPPSVSSTPLSASPPSSYPSSPEGGGERSDEEEEVRRYDLKFNTLCKIHQIELDSFCCQENTFTCSNCYLKGYDHFGHTQKKLSEMYEETNDKMEQMISDTGVEVKTLSDAVSEIEATLVAVNQTDAYVNEKLSAYFAKAHAALNRQEAALRSQFSSIKTEKTMVLKRQRDVVCNVKKEAADLSTILQSQCHISPPTVSPTSPTSSSSSSSSLSSSISFSSLPIAEIPSSPLTPAKKKQPVPTPSVLNILQCRQQLLSVLETLSGICLEPNVDEKLHFDEKILPADLPRSNLIQDFTTSTIHTTASGEGLTRIYIGQNNLFTLIACDRKGIQKTLGGDRFIISFNHGTLDLEYKIIDHRNGRYGVSFYVPSSFEASCLIVSIQFYGYHIQGSPFRLPVHHQRIEGSYSEQWGSLGDEVGKLAFPSQLSVNLTTEELYVVDTSNHRIQILGIEDFKVRRVLGEYGFGQGMFNRPWAACIDPRNGEVYVSDCGNKRIQVFSKKGEFLRCWTVREAFGLQLDVHHNLLYVCDCTAHLIQVFSTDGELIREWGGKGTTDGLFSSPHALALDDFYDWVYVLDHNNHRVQVFTPEGRFVRKWGTHGAGSGEFMYPDGLVISGDYLYVSDCSFHRIQIFDKKDGSYIEQFSGSPDGSVGNGKLRGNLYGLLIHRQHLYVADCNNSRITIFT